jgi:hypothetical protein
MKIYNRQDFLKLGICLFCKGCQWEFYNLCIKGDTLHDCNYNGIDFCYRSLCDIDANDSAELADFYEEMLKDGVPKELNQAFLRDGSFDDSEVFLVYEAKDLKELMYTIRKVIYERPLQ